MVDDENYFKQLQSNHTIPANDADVIDVSKNMQANDTIVAVPIIPQKNLPLEIRKELNKDIATADDIIEEIVDDQNYTNQLHLDKSSTPSDEAIKHKQSVDPITIISDETDKNLIKKIAISDDVIEELVGNRKHQTHSAKSGPTNNEEENNAQSNDSNKTVSDSIEKELIKDVTTATAIIEKIIANKDYFNLLNKDKDIPFINTIPKQEPLGLPSKRIIDSDQHTNIEKNLIKDIASAVAIINDIIWKDIDTNLPDFKQTTIANKKTITRKVREIISTAIVSPNLVTLEKSIKELLSRRSIFTNFKA